MGLEDIRDQLRDQAIALWGRVLESSAFNSLKEQYHTWPAIVQKAAAFAGGFVVVLVILSVPYSYIDSASVAVEEFSEYRTLLRDLLRIGRAAKDPPPLPPGQTAAELTGQVQGVLGEFQLVPEQVAGVSPLEERPAASLAPPVIRQEGVAVNLKKLNLYQILDIGFRLQSMSPGIKLTGLDIAANSDDNHYFDVMYKIVSFSLPFAAEEPEKPPAKEEKSGGDE